MSDHDWDHTTDVLVIGSGAGALTAALRAHDNGAQTLVIEKTALYGGSSAMSGGVLWLPSSPMIARAGGSDSPEEAKRYMKSVIGEPSQHARIDAFVDTIPRFVEYLHAKTRVYLESLVGFPDMYPDNPDFKMHRCHEPLPFNGGSLGDGSEIPSPPAPADGAVRRHRLDRERVAGPAGARQGLAVGRVQHGRALCAGHPRPAARHARSPPGARRCTGGQPAPLDDRAGHASVARHGRAGIRDRGREA